MATQDKKAGAAPNPDNTMVDANIAPTPVPDAPGGASVSTTTATADDTGNEAVVVLGKANSDGTYNYVRVQPYGVLIGDSVPTAPVADSAGLLNVYVNGAWRTLVVDNYPPVTSNDREALSSVFPANFVHPAILDEQAAKEEAAKAEKASS